MEHTTCVLFDVGLSERLKMTELKGDLTAAPICPIQIIRFLYKSVVKFIKRRAM